MQEGKKTMQMRHNVIMQDRHKLTISGVMDIDSFDEELVVVYTEQGELRIRGANLHMNKIDVDTGDLLVEGQVDSLSYSDNISRKGGFFSKLFR